MLHFVIGTAGTGKTHCLLEKINQVAQSGGKAIYLVPEQFSFEAERLILRRLGAKQALNVEVLSFTRLCNSVFCAFGGLSGTKISRPAKYVLMSIAIKELQDSLVFYRKSCANTAFLQTMVSACSELKTSGIDSEILSAFSKNCTSEKLAEKTGELATIYSAYSALISRSFVDCDDDIARCNKLLQEQDYFGEYTVFVDGFTTFLSGEFALLEHITTQSKDCFFALTTDSLYDSSGGMGVFSPVKAAANRLMVAAKLAGIPIATPEVLTQLHRYQSKELAHISAEYFCLSPLEYTQKPSDVHIFSAGNRYDEVQYIAAKIASLVREKGVRYNQIAVVTRDTDLWECPLDTVFSRYDLPYFHDTPQDIENKLIVSGILSALEAVRSNFAAEAVLAFAKSPLVALDLTDVAAVENYCYCWGIRGLLWQGEFCNNPRGLATSITQSDALLLQQINATRQQIIQPLLNLKQAFEKCSGRAFAGAIYDCLVGINAAENILAYGGELEQSQKSSFLDESAQLWDIIIDLLDVFGTVIGSVPMPAGRMVELFRLAISAVEVAHVPQTLDQILVGQADRIRPASKDYVFVFGANEGEFPAASSSTGVFTDTERRLMIESGVGISPPALEQSVLEQFFAYYSLTLPSKELFVSYSRSDLTGKERLPSVIITQLHSLFPLISNDNLSLIDTVQGEKSALDLFASTYAQNSQLQATLSEFFAREDYGQLVKRMNNAHAKPVHALENTNNARELFGKSMRLSPSKIEKYYTCPFAYFVAEGLRLKQRKKVEFTPLESGSVIHFVLQVMLQRHGGKGLAKLSSNQIKKEVTQIIQQYLSGRVQELSKLPARFQYLFARLTAMLTRLLQHLGREFLQSGFDPVEFELPIGYDGKIEPMALQTLDGTSVCVEGIVDRVDVMNKNGKRYVRVVDYKSGSKTFKLYDILYGLNMQMLLYLFTIGQNGKGELAQAIPAGVLYMPVKEKYCSANREDGVELLQSQIQKQWRMNGLILEDDEVVTGMEQEVAGVFIPVKVGKSGEYDASSSLANIAQMGKLAEKVSDLVVEMATALCAGKIAACPVDSPDYVYCNYRSVCGFEEGDDVRTIAQVDKEAFYKLLEEENDHGR